MDPTNKKPTTDSTGYIICIYQALRPLVDEVGWFPTFGNLNKISFGFWLLIKRNLWLLADVRTLSDWATRLLSPKFDVHKWEPVSCWLTKEICRRIVCDPRRLLNWKDSLDQVFKGDDGEKFERNWLYWTGDNMWYGLQCSSLRPYFTESSMS